MKQPPMKKRPPLKDSNGNLTEFGKMRAHKHNHPGASAKVGVSAMLRPVITPPKNKRTPRTTSPTGAITRRK